MANSKQRRQRLRAARNEEMYQALLEMLIKHGTDYMTVTTLRIKVEVYTQLKSLGYMEYDQWKGQYRITDKGVAWIQTYTPS